MVFDWQLRLLKVCRFKPPHFQSVFHLIWPNTAFDSSLSCFFFSQLDWDSLTTETVLSRSFHKVSRHRLDPVWNQLSARTRQLASDLRTLRSLLLALPQLDCCGFYQLVAAQQTAERALNSGWAILDAAETVFVDARRRVFGDFQPQARRAVRSEGSKQRPKGEP